MKTVKETVDVVIAGGGTAGHIAALQASRTGVKTSVIEAGTMLGGTMTAGGVVMPDYFFSTEGPVVLGIGWELYKKSKEVEGLPIPDYRKRRPVETPGHYSYINVPIYVAIAEEEAVKPGVILHYCTASNGFGHPPLFSKRHFCIYDTDKTAELPAPGC